MTVIEVRDLRMHYGSRDVLQGVDFQVGRGEVIALLGAERGRQDHHHRDPGGLPDALGRGGQRARVDPANGDERWRARIGVVLQSWRDHGRWKVHELLEHLGGYYTPYATPERPRPQDVDELLETVGLAGQAKQRLASLSGGQRRRLDVAVGLVGRPELLFLDEPTAGFDPLARRDFHDLVHRLSDLEDTTILLTTHDLAEAEQLADRILILAEGRIVADGSADQLAREVAGQAEVRWSRGAERFVHASPDATRFVRELFAQYGDEVTDLEVRRASLEDTYMVMLHRHEQGHLQEVSA
jgi:ABC-2 type transport system ATP-binding protein